MGGGLALGGPGENPRSVTPKRGNSEPSHLGLHEQQRVFICEEQPESHEAVSLI